MRWIFSSFVQDMAWLYLPPLLFLGAAHVGEPGLWTPAVGWGAIMFANLCDLGHTYVTGWRTYLRPAEFRRTRILYLAAPFVILPVIYGFVAYDFELYRNLTAYLILLHAIRQYYGQMRWYERLNGAKRPAAAYFMYALCIWPLVMYHFSPPMVAVHKGPEILHWPNPSLFAALGAGYGLLIASWLVYEARLSLQGCHEWNRRIAIAVPALLYASVNIFGGDMWQTVVPLAIGHGFAYTALTGLAIERLDRRPRRSAMLRALLTMGGLGAVMIWLTADPVRTPFLFSVFMTPVFCHYLFDARIWTGKHSEAPIIYTRDETKVAS